MATANYAAHIVGGLVRELWPTENLIEEVISEEPILGIATKETDWGYAVVHHPLGWGANQGIGRDYATAKRIRGAAKSAEFQLATREMFASLSLEGKLLRTFEYTKKKALLVEPVKREGEATIDRMKRRFCRAIHGNGTGVVGRITAGSNTGTATVTLTNPNDLKNFEEGTVVQASSAAGTGSLRASGAEAVIVSIGTEDNPTLTITGNWTASITGVAASDYLFHTGTHADDYFDGLDAYLPLHTGSPGTFLTCNRNLNPGWLAGRCMNGTVLSVFQRIKKAARIAVDAGGKPDTYLLSTRNFERLEFEMDNKLQLAKVPAADVGKFKLGVSYDGVVIQGPRGPITVLPSHWMPDNVERCGERKTLKFGSIGPLVHWDLGNGPGSQGGMRTEDDSDGREVRAVSDPAFLVTKPGAWVRVAV